MGAPLLAWPWQRLGDFKYVVLAPIAFQAFFARGERDFCFHILALTVGRWLVYQLWQSFSRLPAVSGKRRLSEGGLSYEQVDREWHCDNPSILHALLLFIANAWLPCLGRLPAWNAKGLLIMALLHAGPAECLYYWAHRAFHTKLLFGKYHQLHHMSVTTEPSTAGTGTFLEHVVLASVIAIPVVGTSLLGGGSVAGLYVYFLLFEFMRAMGHCNSEVVPLWVFERFGALRYLVYTPSYHSTHHKRLDKNFCLFMPLHDCIWGTRDEEAWAVHAHHSRGGLVPRVPDYVFLLHAVDFSASLQTSFVFRSLASHPFRMRWFLVPFSFGSAVVGMAMWAWARVFVAWSYYLRDPLPELTTTRFHQVWVVPRFGFQYFLPGARQGINNLIEQAILDADEMGVKVISLAALNKNEALNRGGALFVEKHPQLKVRVCHGNTLTAAVIVHEIPSDVTEVFLTGATSKLGRAIALYLCRRGVRVLMLTGSRNRFESIAGEALAEHRNKLVQVTKYQAGKNCKTWILGKWITYSEQMGAPAGTHFHQFVVPPVIPFRRNCTYGKLAALQLPDSVSGLACCEYTNDRNVVHACHAGGVVHSLEGWTHHEVGALDVDRIDPVWEAARKHGFRLP